MKICCAPPYQTVEFSLKAKDRNSGVILCAATIEAIFYNVSREHPASIHAVRRISLFIRVGQYKSPLRVVAGILLRSRETQGGGRGRNRKKSNVSGGPSSSNSETSTRPTKNWRC
ncbi:MAG: hypothetical protein NTX48_19895 [Planctomycetales bacterium]|nr:hypothetical protein [Planctomycetales bacterium]